MQECTLFLHRCLSVQQLKAIRDMHYISLFQCYDKHGIPFSDTLYCKQIANFRYLSLFSPYCHHIAIKIYVHYCQLEHIFNNTSMCRAHI